MPTENQVAPAATDTKIQAIAAAKPGSKPSPKAAAPLPPVASPTKQTNLRPPAAPVNIAATTPPAAAPSEPTPAPQPVVPAPAPAWSSEDESAFQAMLARRKAAGYQRRGKDVGSMVLSPGEITPNAGTVVAKIVALVAERGKVARSELLDAMAKTPFPHAKARPEERGWCQGYVAGALRDGFLAVVGEDSPANNSRGAEQ